MHITDDFRQSKARLVGSCEELIARGNVDPVAYELFARIHLRPWLLDIRQVAERLTETELIARAAGSTETSAILGHLRASAEHQLALALDIRDANMAARAAVFLCGVGLAIEAAQASMAGPEFGDP